MKKSYLECLIGQYGFIEPDNGYEGVEKLLVYEVTDAQEEENGILLTIKRNIDEIHYATRDIYEKDFIFLT